MPWSPTSRHTSVARAAAVTRRSAAVILSGIDANVFGLFQVTPEEFIKKAAQLIVSEKAAMIVEHISYHEIDGRYDTAVFTERMPDNASKAYEAKKNIQRFVFPDSDGERKFAEDMDAAAEAAVYAKLPRTFQIPTPVGNYAPDWAIAFKEGSVRHVFFVAETQGAAEIIHPSLQSSSSPSSLSPRADPRMLPSCGIAHHRTTSR